jgi:hypothetical protein
VRLVTLLGEDLAQSLGALYTLRQEIREILLLVNHDKEEQQRGERFKQNLQNFGRTKGLKWRVMMITIHKSDIDDLKQLYQMMIEDEKETIFFPSDATTAPTLILSSFFLQDGRGVLSYDAYENQICHIEKGTITTYKADLMSIATYCAMLGYEIVDTIEEKQFIHDKESVIQLFKHESRFQKVRRALLNNDNDFPYKHYGDIMKILHQIGILKSNQFTHESARRRLQGQLFEEYVYWHCKEAGFDDVLLGCKIDFSPNSEEKSHVFNEFDILFIDDNRIGTVECKYVHRLDGLAFVYKYDAIIDYFGRTARALIVNIYQREKKRGREENFYGSVLRRARLGNVRVYTDQIFDPTRFQTHLLWMKGHRNHPSNATKA